MNADLAIKSVLLKTINTPEEFSDCFQLYSIPPEDIEFIKSQLLNNSQDLESHLDTLLRLFIAFFAESLPEQVTYNLTHGKSKIKPDDKTQKYLLAIAGILHEAKMVLKEYSELFMPYVLAYEEFTKNMNGKSIVENESLLLSKFVSNVESAIQAVIKA